MGRRQFGTARCLPSGAWQARYINEVGRRITAPETFATKADALHWLTLLEADLLRGTYLDPRAGQVTFDEWSEDWLASKPDKRASSIARDRAALRTHFSPAFGHLALASVTPVHVRGVVSAMRRAGLSPKSVRTYVGTLAAIFNAAVDADLIARSPVRGFHLETVRRRERPTVAPTTLIDLADEVPGRFRVLILTAGILGLRWSEAIALRVSDIGFLTRTIDVRQTVEEVSGHVRVMPFTKTDASRRTIAVPPVTSPNTAKVPLVMTWSSSENEVASFAGASWPATSSRPPKWWVCRLASARASTFTDFATSPPRSWSAPVNIPR